MIKIPSERPRDSRGRFISYTKCKRKDCRERKAQITELQSSLTECEKKWLTSVAIGAFLAALAAALLVALIIEMS